MEYSSAWAYGFDSSALIVQRGDCSILSVSPTAKLDLRISRLTHPKNLKPKIKTSQRFWRNGFIFSYRAIVHVGSRSETNARIGTNWKFSAHL